MWTLSWGFSDEMEIYSCYEAIQKINELNQEFQNKQPIIIQIESKTKKSLTIGVGTKEGLSCLTFFPSPNGLGSMHLISSNALEYNYEESIIFWLDSYDCEWEIEKLVTYEEAINEVLYFLKNDDVDTSLNWELD